MSNLIEHAKLEMKRAGLFDTDSNYGGMLGPAIMKMIEVFSAEGHTGMSANITLGIFDRLARFKTLSPITDDPEEWFDLTGNGMGPDPAWQNKRDSSCFSNDGGKSYYSVDDQKRENKLSDKSGRV